MIADAPESNGALRGSLRRGHVVSVALHLLLLALLFGIILRPPAEETSGTGWAEQIEITASDRSSSGFAGTAEENRKAAAPERGDPLRDAMLIEIVAPDALVPAPEIPEADRFEAAEEIPPKPLARAEVTLPPEPAPPAAPAATPPQAAAETGALALGGQGMQEAPLGSVTGRDAAGAGAGNADARGRGTMLTGQEIAAALTGFTIIGQEGFWDGSTASNTETRTEYPWAVYYAPDGGAEAKFQRPAAAVPHGPVSVREFEEDGRWRIEGDLLCQGIKRIGSGVPVCFEVHRDGNAVAMYYARCGALTRCTRGRLGPQGVLVQGRAL